MVQFRATTRTALGDYPFRLCLDREGFQAIPDTLYFRDRQMMVIVEGRWAHCCNCKQVGHLAKVCPQKTAGTVLQPKETEINTTNSTNLINTTDTTNASPGAKINKRKDAGHSEKEEKGKNRLKLRRLKRLLLKPQIHQLSSNPKEPFCRNPFNSISSNTQKSLISQTTRPPTKHHGHFSKPKKKKGQWRRPGKKHCKTPKPQPQQQQDQSFTEKQVPTDKNLIQPTHKLIQPLHTIIQHIQSAPPLALTLIIS